MQEGIEREGIRVPGRAQLPPDDTVRSSFVPYGLPVSGVRDGLAGAVGPHFLLKRTGTVENNFGTSEARARAVGAEPGRTTA